jgi:hypothetical protein
MSVDHDATQKTQKTQIAEKILGVLVTEMLPFVVMTTSAYILHGRQTTPEEAAAEIAERYNIAVPLDEVARVLADACGGRPAGPVIVIDETGQVAS